MRQPSGVQGATACCCPCKHKLSQECTQFRGRPCMAPLRALCLAPVMSSAKRMVMLLMSTSLPGARLDMLATMWSRQFTTAGKHALQIAYSFHAALRVRYPVVPKQHLSRLYPAYPESRRGSSPSHSTSSWLARNLLSLQCGQVWGVRAPARNTLLGSE